MKVSDLENKEYSANKLIEENPSSKSNHAPFGVLSEKSIFSYLLIFLTHLGEIGSRDMRLCRMARRITSLLYYIEFHPLGVDVVGCRFSIKSHTPSACVRYDFIQIYFLEFHPLGVDVVGCMIFS